MDEIRKLLEELRDIVFDYDSLLDKACGQGIYSEEEYTRMDANRNRANEIIDSLEI